MPFIRRRTAIAKWSFCTCRLSLSEHLCRDSVVWRMCSYSELSKLPFSPESRLAEFERTWDPFFEIWKAQLDEQVTGWTLTNWWQMRAERSGGKKMHVKDLESGVQSGFLCVSPLFSVLIYYWVNSLFALQAIPVSFHFNHGGHSTLKDKQHN